MRLLNTRTLASKQFCGRCLPYAILSHMWEGEEVTHQDVRDKIPTLESQHGYRKIKEYCRIAAEQRLELVWIDTCCIDKTSNAELTESINFMYRWYQQAAACLIGLSDLPVIGQVKVQFYDKDWNLRATKYGLIVKLESITGIPADFLTGRASIRQISIADLMSWAANRQTTRPEDVAYCLLGVFGVKLPMIYGEGDNAFRRLQEEIILKSNDMTIFAWQHNNVGASPAQIPASRSPLLAHSPDNFSRPNKNEIITILSMNNAAMSASTNSEYIVKNKGFCITSSSSISPKRTWRSQMKASTLFLALGR
ncbi:heterokaryon incompatibility protein-domain-containing protein [Triangularia setosa]|uniref:Heterokaryon incompatibility protein-domain-containing protein n=1 Tax=Triangularia setosa TaxID=2587417 RepID=A0AAN6VZI9_9PEZI|nr:heterokaryon incompatibility protein-domain-containing protein [Podospora setosa]